MQKNLVVKKYDRGDVELMHGPNLPQIMSEVLENHYGNTVEYSFRLNPTAYEMFKAHFKHILDEEAQK